MVAICEHCTKTCKSISKLRRHQANIHNIGVVWHHCNVNNCEYKCKDKYNLNKHKARVHNVGVTWYVCKVEGCTLEFKTSSDLKRHQSAVHNIGVKWFRCTECNDKFKTKPNLTRHLRTVHEMGTIWYDCSDCDYKAKSKRDLQDHEARMHDINKVWHSCELCEYKSVSKTDVYRHKQNIHHINVKWHNCPVDDCTYKAKQRYKLKEHISYVHDMGDKICDYCALNRYTLIAHKDKKITYHICRTCLRKATGKDSRAEIIMSKYLDKHFGTEYLLVSDSRVYGDACQRYRPDKLYASPGIILHIECDEHQHAYSGNDYTCDEKRISDIYDEFPGHKYIVIRWNPDKYKPPTGKKKTQKDRMELLLALMAELVQNPPETLITIYYMFYDKDNPLISKNIPHHFVYDENDI